MEKHQFCLFNILNQGRKPTRDVLISTPMIHTHDRSRLSAAFLVDIDIRWDMAGKSGSPVRISGGQVFPIEIAAFRDRSPLESTTHDMYSFRQFTHTGSTSAMDAVGFEQNNSHGREFFC